MRDQALPLAGEARFRVLADAMPQIMYVADSKAEIEYVNECSSDRTGLEHADGGVQAGTVQDLRPVDT